MGVFDNYECDGQISLFDIPEESPKSVKIPCYRECDVEWCSLTCFLRRGYIRHDGKWVRNDKGEILISKNKECDWIPRDDEKPEKAKAPIYHVSLNHVWEECPKCKAYNKATHSERGADGRFYWSKNERCPECNQLFDWSDEAVEKATKYSKDYLEKWRMNDNGLRNRK